MIDLLTRAMLHPLDYSRALLTREAVLLERRSEGEDIYSFVFAMPKPFMWQAGQHAVWRFKDKRTVGEKTWRAFSIASSPHEEVVRIGTRISPEHSQFKDHLLNLQPGESMIINGPFGEFHAPTKPTHIIGVAGGIGITPFRALAYEIAHGRLPQTSLDLLYAAPKQHTYQTELTSWSQNTSNLAVTYVQTNEAVATTLEHMVKHHGIDAPVYLSGSPGMIKALTGQCKAHGVREIVNDPFKGY